MVCVLCAVFDGEGEEEGKESRDWIGSGKEMPLNAKHVDLGIGLVDSDVWGK